MAESGLTQPPSMDFSGNISANWKRFKQRFELYLEATDKASKSDKLKTSLLLHIIGEEGISVYNTFQFTAAQEGQPDPKTVLKTVLGKFDDYFDPKKNVTMERFLFNQCSQEPSETIDHYVTRLKQLSANCEYGTLRDSLLMDRIICGISDNITRERLLRTKDLDLDTCLETCKAAETVKIQAQQLGNKGDNVSVNAVKTKDPKLYQKNKSRGVKTVKTPQKSAEKKCGR